MPAWVVARAPEWDFAPPEGHAIAFLLIDEQHYAGTQASSHRTVRRLLTHAAVQNLGQVELDFDHAAHRLLIHELAVWRQGANGWEKRSLAHRNAFLLRQREQQLELQMLHGRVSVVALLEDVRVGDAIELAWSLELRDRMSGLYFTAFFARAWTVPVARACSGGCTFLRGWPRRSKRSRRSTPSGGSSSFPLKCLSRMRPAMTGLFPCSE